MHKRLAEKFDSWDLKSLALTVLFLSVGLFLYVYFTGIQDRFRADDEENFKGRTTGNIISVEQLQRIRQSKWYGTEIFVDNYKVTYRFNLDGASFQNIDVIPLTTKNQRLLTQILDRGTDSACVVKFDLEDPHKSLLIVSE